MVSIAADPADGNWRNLRLFFDPERFNVLNNPNPIAPSLFQDRAMIAYLCESCGLQYERSTLPPASCPVCEDERQYVAAKGQTWITMPQLAATHAPRIERDAGLLGLGISPPFGIDQRALIITTPKLRVMWEATSLVTPDAVRAITAEGPIDLIAISHPHFYAAMVEWSDALGGVPILIHAADARWIARRSPRLVLWTGLRRQIAPGLQLVHCGGHFPGSAVLHWREGANGRGALFAGDALQVTRDGQHVSFMYSYPNLIPLSPDAVRHIAASIADLEFDDVHGFTWGRNIIGGGKAAVARSVARYLAAIAPAAAPWDSNPPPEEDFTCATRLS